jgi:NTP pyrophosphatase (non-canonical NTP hydrolase)
MNISDMMKEVHDLAIEKGWYEKPKSPLEALMMMVSELAEAAEEVRKGTPYVYQFLPIIVDNKLNHEYELITPDHKMFSSHRKPEGLAVELADCVIRIFDFAEYLKIDLEEAIAMKHAFNKSRPKMHGKLI